MPKLEINKKVMLGIGALASVLFCVAVSSFFPFVFEWGNIKDAQFVTNTAISTSIVIISMASTFFIAQASNASNPKSRIAKANVRFQETASEIRDPNAFSQWVRRVLEPSDSKEAKERYLRERGITDFRILDLERNEIMSLQNGAQLINGAKYKGITKEQANAVVLVKDGKVSVKSVDSTYYLTSKSVTTGKTITERAGTESAKKGGYISVSFVSKMVMSLMFSAVLSAMVRDLTADNDIGGSLMMFSSRLMSMMSGSFSGFLVGCQMNDIDAEYVEMRSLVHVKYLNDKTFKPMTMEEEIDLEISQNVRSKTGECENKITENKESENGQESD